MPLDNPLTQTAQAFIDKNGRPLPLLRTQMGASISQAVTTTANAAVQIQSGDFARAIRIWAIGCPLIYKTGASGVAAPSATADGYVGQDRAIETWVSPDETHIRFAAASGTGTARVEILR